MSRNVNRYLAVIQIAVLVAAVPLYADSERVTGFSSEDTVTIRSAEARMDEQSDIIHFGGSFEIRANDFYLLSEQASLYGKLDDPETIMVSGSPAIIRVSTGDKDEASTINGQAMKIVYERNTNSIRMEGDASLSRGGHMMRGGEIEYDIEKDRLRAGGDGGVHITVDPQ